jgi:uncharacterized protein (TIGR02246 family)
MTDVEREVWQAIRAGNRAWLGGDPNAVAPLFHENAVMLAPGFEQRVVGREAIVGSFVEYCKVAKTLAFEESGESVDVFGNTAVVSYRFKVRYELGGSTHEEAGQELLVLRQQAERWQIVWRTQVPLVASAGLP